MHVERSLLRCGGVGKSPDKRILFLIWSKKTIGNGPKISFCQPRHKDNRGNIKPGIKGLELDRLGIEIAVQKENPEKALMSLLNYDQGRDTGLLNAP